MSVLDPEQYELHTVKEQSILGWETKNNFLRFWDFFRSGQLAIGRGHRGTNSEIITYVKRRSYKLSGGNIQ